MDKNHVPERVAVRWLGRRKELISNTVEVTPLWGRHVSTLTSLGYVGGEEQNMKKKASDLRIT